MLDKGRFPVEFSWFSEGSNAGFMWPTGGLVERLQEHHGKWAVADPTATPQQLSLQSAEKNTRKHEFERPLSRLQNSHILLMGV